MIPTPLSLFSAIPALASRHISSNLRNRSRLAVLGTVLSALLFGAGSISPAQTAHFSGSTPMNWAQSPLAVPGTGTSGGMAVDGSGNIYFANGGKVVSKSTPSGITSNIGTGLGTVFGVAVDGNGNVYIGDVSNHQVVKETPSGSNYVQSVVASSSGGITFYPYVIAVDGSGNVYIADPVNNGVLKETRSGSSYSQSIVFGSLQHGFSSMAVDAGGNIYFTDSFDHAAVKETLVSGNYVQSLVGNTGANCIPNAVAVDTDGNVFIAGENTISVGGNTTNSGAAFVETPLGNSYVQSTISISQIIPTAVAVNGSGNLYVDGTIGNYAGQVVEESPGYGDFGTVNIGSLSPQTVAMTFTFDAAGTLGSTAVLTQGVTGLDFTDAGSDSCVANTAYTAGQTCTVNVTFTPRFAGTRYGAAVLKTISGNIIATGYVQGTGVGPQVNFLPGTQSVLPATGLVAPTGVAVDAGGNVYIVDEGTNLLLKETLSAGSYTQSTIGSGLYLPNGVVVDGSGVIYVADSGNNRVLMETPSPTGYVQSILASGGFPGGVAVDGNGNVYFVGISGSSASDNGDVLKLTRISGIYTQSTVVSGLFAPHGVTVDGSGNLYIADTENFRVLKETLAAGTYTQSILPASGKVEPLSIAVDGNGNVYFADGASLDVVKETPSAGSYVESKVASGLNTLVPPGVAVDGSGNLYIGSVGNLKVVKEDFADPPSLAFATTNAGSTSSDSPQTITVENIGNAPLTFPIPSTGNNPSISVNFALNSSSSSDCPLLTSESSEPGMLAAGATCQLPISFTPTAAGALSGSLVLADNSLNPAAPGFGLQSISLNGTGMQGTPTITWGTPAAIPYGTALSATQLNATTLAPGSFTYSPAAGTVLSLGQQTLTTTFTPTSTTDYTTASATVTLTVNQATPTITWATPAAITYGTPLSATQLNATSTVAGTFTYSPAAGTVLGEGPQNLTATFTPTDATDYTTASAIVTLTVAPPPGFAPSSENFGAVNIGTPSPVLMLTYTFGSAITLGSTSVLTQGATGLDFTDAGSDTCAANTAYAVGQSCTLNVSFTPRFPGTRYGAVVLNDNNGNVIATAYLQGSGIGPQINFLPATQSALGSGYYNPMGVAVDSSGDVYVADETHGEIKEVLAVNGRIPSSPTINILASGLSFPQGVAVDGAGNVYVTDTENNAVKEILAVNGSIPASPTILTLGSGFSYPWGIAVGGNGNVYVAEPYSNTVEEILAVQGSIPPSPVIVSIGSGFDFPIGVAVDGNGNVYIGDAYNSAVKEIVAVNGSIPPSPTTKTLSSSFYYPAGVAVDGTGNVYLSDYGNNTVKKILAVNGVIPASPTIETLTSGVNAPYGLAVDSGANVYIADTQNNRVLELDSVDPPSLSFNSTNVPQTVTVENVGNAALTFPIPSAGNNPNMIGNFSLDSSVTAACPLLSSTSSANGSLPAGASCQLPISFTSTAAGTLSGALVLTDTNLNAAAPGYTSQSITLSGTGVQATPTITWAAPTAITYGTPLSTTQLNASSTVTGTFTYSPAAGTVLTAGTHTLTATFTPTDTTDYTTATATVTFTVNQATPSLTWPTPTPITYGTSLSATQLNATSTVAGFFTYSPAIGTLLTAGAQTLTATFIPTDTTDYKTSTASVTITVNKATPTIAWAAPAAITYGTPLTASQLNATSTVAGTFNYSPAAGSILNAGTQSLSVTFTPTDTTDYTTAVRSVSLTVNKAALIVTWATPAAIPYGTALSATQLDATSNAAGTYSYSPAAGTVLSVGNHTLSVTFTPSNPANYTTTTAARTVTLTVNKAAPTITWATPAAISYGTKLSGTQLDASASVAGTFAYSPASGTVLAVGNNTLKVTFTPSNTTDYTTATASVTLTVDKATPVITWAKPSAITYGTALSSTQLNASSAVAGTFKYSPASGTVLGAGSQTLSVTFTPSNTTDYTTATASVTLTVNKATPAITWATPKAITHGTPLSATQLNATSKVAGTFTYSPAAGTVLAVGNQKLTVTFTPTNATDYTTATASVTLTVNK